MNFKAIVLDLDGTLMTSKNEISQKTKELLLYIQKLGIKVILASGRPTKGMEKVSQELKLHEYGGYLLSYNGGRIVDVKNKKVLYESYLDKERIMELFNYSRKLDAHLMAYNDDDTIVTEDDDEYIQLEVRINNLPVEKLNQFKESTIKKSVKCLMTGVPHHLEDVERKLKDIYQDTLSISRSMPFFLECMPKGINKGICLHQLLNLLHINADEVIACGDGYNDIALIEAVPYGIAMENGCDEIKAKARYITYSNDQDGIAHVIEKFILNEVKTA